MPSKGGQGECVNSKVKQFKVFSLAVVLVVFGSSWGAWAGELTEAQRAYDAAQKKFEAVVNQTPKDLSSDPLGASALKYGIEMHQVQANLSMANARLLEVEATAASKGKDRSKAAELRKQAALARRNAWKEERSAEKARSDLNRALGKAPAPPKKQKYAPRVTVHEIDCNLDGGGVIQYSKHRDRQTLDPDQVEVMEVKPGFSCERLRDQALLPGTLADLRADNGFFAAYRTLERPVEDRATADARSKHIGEVLGRAVAGDSELPHNTGNSAGGAGVGRQSFSAP